MIGGGIAGCAAAYYLARASVEVMLIERSDLNAHGSGANAGSLHALVISRLGKMADPIWLAAQEPLVRLLAAGIETWRELSEELDTDIEFATHGGLMVAETPAQLARLSTKIAIERRGGLSVDIVTGSDLMALAPYLSPDVIGASFCENEGKVNPLLATPALARGAERAGAHILCQTELRHLQVTMKGFEAQTNNGQIRCKRVVNAAGPWADDVAAMVGVRLPLQRLPRHMNVTERTAPLVPHLVQHVERWLSLKQSAAGNIVIGGGWPAVMNPATSRVAVLTSSIQGSLWVARHVVPQIGKLRLLRCWGGILCFTADGSAVLGELPGVPGFFMLLPPSAGYTAGPVSARLLAELMGHRAPSRTSVVSLSCASMARHEIRWDGAMRYLHRSAPRCCRGGASSWSPASSP